MITGKRIEVVAVSTGDQVIMCTAPYLSSLFTGDSVEIEGMDGFGTVLIRDTITLGEHDFEILDNECLLRRIIRKVDFTEMNWKGYDDEQSDISGQDD